MLRKLFITFKIQFEDNFDTFYPRWKPHRSAHGGWPPFHRWLCRTRPFGPNRRTLCRSRWSSRSGTSTYSRSSSCQEQTDCLCRLFNTSNLASYLWHQHKVAVQFSISCCNKNCFEFWCLDIRLDIIEILSFRRLGRVHEHCCSDHWQRSHGVRAQQLQPGNLILLNL